MAIDQTKRNTRLANVFYYTFLAVVVVACVLASGLLLRWSFQRLGVVNAHELEIQLNVIRWRKVSRFGLDSAGLTELSTPYAFQAVVQFVGFRLHGTS